MPRRAVIAVAAVLVLAVVALGAWRLLTPSSDLSRAVSLAPADTSRLSWTDWEGVRRELGVDVGAELASYALPVGP